VSEEPRPEKVWTVKECAEFLGVEPTGITNWFPIAACRGINAALFFPERGSDAKPALDVCRACQVAAECLTLAMNEHQKAGVWGRTTDHQRRALRRGYASYVTPIEHGTSRGYKQHLRRGQEACDACRAAHTEQGRINAARRNAS
jgi:hypothetical protein